MERNNQKITDYNAAGKLLNDDVFMVSENVADSFSRKNLLIVDTSVVIKWFFQDNEKNTFNASIILNEYLNNKIRIVIPELSVYELANVLKSKIQKYESDQLDIIDRVYKMGILFYIKKEVLKSAVKMAIDINESVYDCIFLATAEYFMGRFITDDEVLFRNYINYKRKIIEIIRLKDYE